MAKKKDGSGSNLGLIITLVFFVLSTVILGVTTYLGFSGQTELEAKTKEAQQKATVASDDAKWANTRVRILQTMLGGPVSAEDSNTAAREKAQLEEGTYSGPKDDEKAKFNGYVDEAGNRGIIPRWEAKRSAIPTKTVEQLLAEKKLEIKKEQDKVAMALKSAEQAKTERDDLQAKLDNTIKQSRADLDAVKVKSEADVKASESRFESYRKDIADANAKFNEAKDKVDKYEKNLASLQSQVKRLNSEVGDLKRNLRTVTEERDTRDVQLTQALEELGKPRSKIEESVKDARFAQMLKEWKRDWKIMDLDRKGGMVYINLGSADNLQPQVTFSVHSAGIDGQLSPASKASIEVVRVMGSHLSLARITSEKDGKNFKKDPIVRGDKLFNPTWDPYRKRHVAIAGLADLGGDGSDNMEDLRRLLKRQNVEIDAYIDVKSDKMPKLEGNITSKTDYLILADSLEAVNHPQSRNNKEYMNAFQRIERDMKSKAADNGVQVISLRRYLDMIGYESPKVVKPITGNYSR